MIIIIPTGFSFSAPYWAELDGSGSGGGISSDSSGLASQNPIIKLDSLGLPHIAYQNQYIYQSYPPEYDVYYVHFNGSSWTTYGNGNIDMGVSGNFGDSIHPDMVLDSNDYPHLVWDNVSPQGDLEIFYKKWNGYAWTTLAGADSNGGISDNTTASQYPSLEVDVYGNPHAVWQDLGNYATTDNLEIFHRYWNGSGWTTFDGADADGGLSRSVGTSKFPRITLDSNGYPNVVWQDLTNGNYEIYFVRWNGSSWTSYGNANQNGGISNNSGTSQYPDIALDLSNRPHVTWEDNSSGIYQIYYKYWNGSSWVENNNSASGSGISNGSSTSKKPSIDIDTSSHPHISWTCQLSGPNTEIYFKYWNGSSWLQIANSAQSVGVSDTYTASSNSSIHLSPNNIPYITWQEYISSDFEIYMRYLADTDATQTPTPTTTPNPTPSPSQTPTQTITQTPTMTITQTVTATPTWTEPPTPTETPTNTITKTPTITKTATLTKTATPTDTDTPSNQYPILSDGKVQPLYGNTDTTFTFSVYYSDDEGAPWFTRVYYNNGYQENVKSMTLTSGYSNNGTYTKETTLTEGNYYYYFYFQDPQGYEARYPASGYIYGPYVSPASTSTETATPSSTPQPTITETQTPTETETSTPQQTPTETETSTPTITPTETPTPTPTPGEYSYWMPYFKTHMQTSTDSLLALTNPSDTEQMVWLDIFDQDGSNLYRGTRRISPDNLSVFYLNSLLNADKYGSAKIGWDNETLIAWGAAYNYDIFKGYPISIDLPMMSPIYIPFFEVLPGLISTSIMVSNPEETTRTCQITLYDETGVNILDGTSFIVQPNETKQIILDDYISEFKMGSGKIQWSGGGQLGIYGLVTNTKTNTSYPLTFNQPIASGGILTNQYLPFWQTITEESVTTLIALSNPGSENTFVRVRFYDEQGNYLGGESPSIRPNQMLLMNATDYITGNGTGSAEISWDTGILNAWSALYKGSNATGYPLSIGEPRDRIIYIPFFQVNYDEMISTFIILNNIADTEASATITYYSQTGQHFGTDSLTVPPNQTVTTSAKTVVKINQIGWGSVSINTGSLNVWGLIYSDKEGTGFALTFLPPYQN